MSRSGAGDIAVIVENHKDARACYDALCRAGIPAVYTGDSDIFGSDAAEDWLCLLEAFDQPHRPGHGAGRGGDDVLRRDGRVARRRR